MANKGYRFYVGDLELPYAPSKLNIKVGSKNTTVDLINGGEINILKEPKLQEISFDVELPRGRQYPFANKLVDPKVFIDYFNNLMLNKKPTKLLIIRPIVTNGRTRYQESEFKKVSLEGFDWKEDADNAFDITLSLTFKEYIEYGTAKKTVVNNNKSKVQETPRAVEKTENYKVKTGDCLWKIARKYYGTGTKWKTIYEANKSIMESTARKYGRRDSNNGWWIYPGTVLKIPVTTNK